VFYDYKSYQITPNLIMLNFHRTLVVLVNKTHQNYSNLFLKSQIAVIPPLLKTITSGGILKTTEPMPTTIITTDDLREFKIELLEDIEALLSKFNTKPEPISWLRSADVKRKLNISNTTLQKLRNKKILKGHKIEGILFYDAAEIDRILLESAVQNEDNRA
jgi:hypothetical protein